MNEVNTKQVKPLPPLKVGDKVIRYLAGEVPMPLIVTAIKPNGVIVCGGPEYPGADWEFDPKFGEEIDEYMAELMAKHGFPKGTVVSYIVPAPVEGVA